MRRIGAGRRTRRLRGGVSRSRSWIENDIGRTRTHAWRRLSERRLHSVESVATHCSYSTRGARAGGARDSLWRAKNRFGQITRLQIRCRIKAHHRFGEPGAGAQGEVVTGTGSFVNTHHLEAETQDGTTRIQFRQAIIAAGSEPVKLPFLPIDSRIVDST